MEQISGRGPVICGKGSDGRQIGDPGRLICRSRRRSGGARVPLSGPRPLILAE